LSNVPFAGLSLMMSG